MSEFCNGCPIKGNFCDQPTMDNMRVRTNGIHPNFRDSKLVINFVDTDGGKTLPVDSKFNLTDLHSLPRNIGVHEILAMTEVGVNFIKRRIIDRIDRCDSPGIRDEITNMGILRTPVKVGTEPFCRAINSDAIYSIISGVALTEEMRASKLLPEV